jgi:methyl-accepting chemotaxis protein
MVNLLTKTLNPVEESSEKIRGLAAEVSNNSKQQAESLGQVLEAVEQIQRASESSAQAAQKGAHDAVELEGQVAFLVRSISEIDGAIDLLNKEFG